MSAGFENRSARKGRGSSNLPLSVFLKLPAVSPAGGFISESMIEGQFLDCPQFVIAARVGGALKVCPLKVITG